jgi:hypothetical protein
VTKETGLSEEACVDGTFTYTYSDPPVEGKLYYARPAITKTSPADVSAYQRQDNRFPHDPTDDQLYTDQRFEAYRRLGFASGESAATLAGRAT